MSPNDNTFPYHQTRARIMESYHRRLPAALIHSLHHYLSVAVGTSNTMRKNNTYAALHYKSQTIHSGARCSIFSQLRKTWNIPQTLIVKLRERVYQLSKTSPHTTLKCCRIHGVQWSQHRCVHWSVAQPFVRVRSIHLWVWSFLFRSLEDVKVWKVRSITVFL
jgi:hypothetical protein